MEILPHVTYENSHSCRSTSDLPQTCRTGLAFQKGAPPEKGRLEHLRRKHRKTETLLRSNFKMSRRIFSLLMLTFCSLEIFLGNYVGKLWHQGLKEVWFFLTQIQNQPAYPMFLLPTGFNPSGRRSPYSPCKWIWDTSGLIMIGFKHFMGDQTSHEKYNHFLVTWMISLAPKISSTFFLK